MYGWRLILITVVLTSVSLWPADVQVLGKNLATHHNESVCVQNRLSESVTPGRYVLAISPDFLKDEFFGAIRIDIEIRKARSCIALHAKDLRIASIKLHLFESRKEISIESVSFVELHELLVLKTRNVLAPGRYFLRANFSGSLVGKTNGFYLSTYAHSDGSVRKLAVSQFEPFYARTAFPCFDEPRFKSVFLIRIVHSGARYHALSNMPITKVTKMENDGGKIITFFGVSPPMPTYLVAYVVSDFECVTSSMILLNRSKIPLSVCTRSMYRYKSEFALSVAERVMLYYSRVFGIDYPLPKLDLVAVPDFAAGAMENWGLITFRETEVLRSEDHSSAANTKSVASTVAHELAHMWFGNLVTLKWWNDLWLNEGFATYMEHRAMQFVFPEWSQMESFALYTKYVSMKHDGKSSVRPIVKRVEDREEIEETFDAISYQKAAAVIRMSSDAFGDYKFVHGLRNYLASYQFRNTDSRDLFQVLRNNSRGTVDIGTYMERWIKLPGFPVINARRDSGVFQLTQRRFAMGKFREPESEAWDISVKYVTSRKEDGVKFAWFLANYSCVELSPEKPINWIKLNHNSVGYYIVNYTDEEWKAFGELLSRDLGALNPTDRADLLHDAFLLAEGGHLCYCTAMNFTRYLVNEIAYQPWTVAAEWLVHVNRLLEATNVRLRFQSYAQSLVDRIYRNVGWKIGRDESFVDREMRVLILTAACSIGHSDCLTTTGKRLKSFLKSNGVRKPAADIRSIVYSFGLVAQSEVVGSIFENMSRLFARETDQHEKHRLMIGLASVYDKNVLNRYLVSTINNDFVRKQDFYEILVRIASNSAGLDIVWNFLRSNWNVIGGKYSLNDYAMGRAIVAIVSFFQTEQKLEEAKQFLAGHPDIRITENARRDVIEEVENKVNWLNANVGKIDRWLRLNGFD